ncbi:1-deoxy-D-xylulose-5-phosphate reductoisomerase [Wolbachia pipientis]|uniref:1-deoxy-D-xylulose 5-phosphate reductoisomerase n=1 Tax=Wolbachia pipientis TaxID=955 RepID=A0A1E7QKK3_WOLPI|nr:1-deoxy-D-xylulose-5-phosphate reductoisomerase [Wolbachia pipientis]OEY86749.1 1-deoxy-D-xylulose-5-phosphate reductoisomerase [Wolbachia pipientis]
MKKVSVIGSTGSIGKKAVDLLLHNREEYKVIALSAYSNFALLTHQAKLLDAEYVVISNKEFYKNLKEELLGTNIKIEADLINIAAIPVELLIVAVVGIAGLEPVIHAIENGTKTIALANKESIVCGGKLLFKKAKENGTQIIPIDSEHSAIFQILENNGQCIEKIILTASGGPFLNYSNEQLKNATINKALTHPTWNMGKKISIDSATMMNKALEVIEAHNLFDINPNKIEVIVHPESVIHGIAVYPDGTNFALMALPDMTLPISYAMSWPQRSALSCKLDLAKQNTLTFQAVDHERFPAVNLSIKVLNSHSPDVYSIVLNAANEVAVNAFLTLQIEFLEIIEVINLAIENFSNYTHISSLSDIIYIDRESRAITQEFIDNKTCNQKSLSM